MMNNELTKEEVLDVWSELIAYWRWYPDAFLECITPVNENGERQGITLGSDQKLILRVLCRFPYSHIVLPRGFGKCVSGDTLLLTDNGLVEIGSYFNYKDDNKESYIISDINIVNRYGKLESTNAGVYNGLKDTKIIKNDLGIEIEVSNNHPLLTVSDNGDFEWKKAIDITTDDYIISRRGDNVWGKTTSLNIDMKSWLDTFDGDSRWKIERVKCNVITELDEELSLIIGYLVGDGCMTMHNNIMFTSKDEDMVLRFINLFENRLGMKVVKKNEIDYVVRGMYVREYFNQIGLKQVNAFEKEIPNCILQAPKNIVSKFVQGLFDTNGSVTGEFVEFCTASEKMSKQLQVVLMNFGIVSRRRRKYNKKYDTYSYIISITGKDREVFLNEIGFSCKRKQDVLIEKINEYKNKKPNTNKDIIPNQQIKILEATNLISKENNKLFKKGIKDYFGHVRKGDNQLTYEKLDRLLECDFGNENNFRKYFEDLKENKYFFSKVVEIKESKNHVYDISVPKTNSFIANSIVNHNTLLELLGLCVSAVLTPDLTISMSAQTLMASAGMFSDKMEEIKKFYPIIADEIVTEQISKDRVFIQFKSGARITNLENRQSAKGKRRNLVYLEECALMDENTYKDAVEPLTSEGYKNIKDFEYDPFIKNRQAFITTAYLKNEAYDRCLKMFDEMVNMKGTFCLGADYRLPATYKRGRTIEQVEALEEKVGSTFFNTNYRSRWLNTNGSCIVDIEKLQKLQVIPKPELKPVKDGEYYISVDVARSAKNSNNETAISVLKIKRDKKEKIKNIQAINMIKLPNGTNFQTQSLHIKRLQLWYNANTVVVDINGLGIGLLDVLMQTQIDPLTGKELPAYDTINTEHESDEKDAKPIVWAIQAQKNQTEMVVSFIDSVENGTLQLLERVDQNKIMDINENDDYMINEILAHIRTQNFIDEVSNLTLETISGGRLQVKQVIKANKDLFSAVLMGVWYVLSEENNGIEEEEEFDFNDLFAFSSPRIR